MDNNIFGYRYNKFDDVNHDNIFGVFVYWYKL